MVITRHQPTPARQNPRAFTLIELLVVLGIIALLTSVLLPTLAGARESARATACLTNLRQLHLALDSYALDHKSHYAPGAPDFLANRTRWFGSRAAATGPFNPAGGPLSEHLGAINPETLRGPRLCPTFQPAPSSPAEAFERAAGGYGYNNAFAGVLRRRTSAPGATLYPLVTDRSGALSTSFSNPSATLAFADAAINTSRGTLIEYPFIEPPRSPRTDPTTPAHTPDPSMHFRHAGSATPRAVGVALDGHAKNFDLGHSVPSSIYGPLTPTMRLGWPEPPRDNRPAPWFDFAVP